MNDKWNIIHGDALKVLGGFSPGTFDAIITDPQQAEYIVWGSNGDMPINRPVPCLPGVFRGCSSTAIPRTAST